MEGGVVHMAGLRTDVDSLLAFLQDLDAFWLLQEEQMELGETDFEAEEAFRELAAAIADGKPLRGSSIWEPSDVGDDLWAEQ